MVVGNGTLLAKGYGVPLRSSRSAGVLGSLIGLLLAFLLVYPNLAKALPSSLKSSSQVFSALQTELQQKRAQQRALAFRIDALKKSGQNAPELKRLLLKSLASEKALRAHIVKTQQHKTKHQRGLLNYLRSIDEQIRRQVPGLKKGSLAQKKATARSINRLRKERQEAVAALSQLKSAQRTPRAWAEYEVRVDPLDGPEELREKADFVDDTKDKVRKKRMLLAQYIRRSQQDRLLAEAEQAFQSSVSLFDEESRTGRVLRNPNARSADRSPQNGEANSVLDQNIGNSNNSNNSNQSPGMQTPAPNESDPSTPNKGTDGVIVATPGRGGDSLGNFQGSNGQNVVTVPPQSEAGRVTESPSSPPTSYSAQTADDSAARGASNSQNVQQLQPDALLNLRVEQLAVEKMDLRELKELLQDLQRLEHYLDAQSQSIRGRAQELSGE